MALAVALDVEDKSLRELLQVSKPFGGKIVILGGDFRQVLPVVPKRSRKEEVAADINNSKAWSLFTLRRLTQNMRTNEDELAFAKWLLEVGDGKIAPEVDLPRECIVQGSLIDKVFGPKCPWVKSKDYTPQ